MQVAVESSTVCEGDHLAVDGARHSELELESVGSDIRCDFHVHPDDGRLIRVEVATALGVLDMKRRDSSFAGAVAEKAFEGAAACQEPGPATQVALQGIVHRADEGGAAVAEIQRAMAQIRHERRRRGSRTTPFGRNA